MPDTHIAVAQDVDRYAAHRTAAAAAAKAKRMWPDVIGDVLADEIMAMLDLPSWLRSQTRTQRLIDAILSITEVREDAAASSSPSDAGASTAAPQARTDGLRLHRWQPERLVDPGQDRDVVRSDSPHEVDSC